MDWYKEPSIGNYDEDFEYWQNHHKRPALLRVIELINSFKGCRSILDVGCRSLGLLNHVTPNYKRRVATDIYHPRFWGTARDYLFVHGNFLKLDFDLFDVVVCLETIEHIRPEERLIFAGKLIELTLRHLIVSIPYKWKDSQEPIPHNELDELFIETWFQIEKPTYEIISNHLLAYWSFT
jgi:hypothetical protein